MTIASVMTYSSLVENIQSYLERTDSATLDKIPLFIMLAEQKIALDIKFLGNLIVVQSTMTATEAIIPKPARWRKTVSMNVSVDGVRTPLLLRKYEYLREYAPDASVTGVPQFYCDYDFDHWLVAPTPALAYNFETLYYQRVPPLDSAQQSNWFTEYAPQALLYGTLLQAAPFLKNDDRIPVWKGEYDLIMQTLKAEDMTRIGDRSAIVQDT